MTQKKLTVRQQIADNLHDAMCTYNHVDYCSYEYEKWDDFHTRRYSAKAEYLEKADRVLKIANDDAQALAFAKALKR